MKLAVATTPQMTAASVAAMASSSLAINPAKHCGWRVVATERGDYLLLELRVHDLILSLLEFIYAPPRQRSAISLS